MPPPRPTHFLCLPLATTSSLPQLTASLALFAQDKAIQQDSDQGRLARQRLPPREREKYSDIYADTGNGAGQSATPKEGYVPIKALRPVGTLHLTLGVMQLNDKNKIDAASELLRTTDIDMLLKEAAQPSENNPEQSHNYTTNSDISTRTPILSTLDSTSLGATKQQQDKLLIQLKGLYAMQQPSKTRVLYAEPIDTSERLLPFCQQLRSKFIREGLMIDEERDLKLHATIINTVYASKRGGSKTKRDFDASDLIERWKDKVWAEVSLDKVAICEMGAKENAAGQVQYLEIAECLFKQ